MPILSPPYLRYIRDSPVTGCYLQASSANSTDYEDEEAECGECGRPLGPGWECESCRRNCPHCNRALTTDPNDYCERCFRKCDKHNLVYSVVDKQEDQGPKCPECRKEQS
ncbi:hypothetical protein BJV82DRAFT_664327 [Fennellomyces sp. T-0311]|nr:hypothetical protein BJV82DRAFT_664327 [Fennellomyces sp. T-0311]